MKAIGYNTNKVYAEGVDKADLHRQLEKMCPFHEGKNSNPLSLEQNHLLPEPMIFAKEVVKDGFKPKQKKVKRKRIWNDENIQFLKDNAEKMTNEQIAKKLKCSHMAVHNKRKKLGLESYKKISGKIAVLMDGSLLKECSSVKEAFELTGVSIVYIYKAMRERNGMAKGFEFKEVK